MSAIGLLASPISFEVAHTKERFVTDLENRELTSIFAAVEADAKAPLISAGLEDKDIEIVRHLDMRYHGQGHEIEVSLDSTETDVADLAALFRQRYEVLYAVRTPRCAIGNHYLEGRGTWSCPRTRRGLLGG